MNKYVAKFKWGTSKGQDSYGYTICSLYINEKKVAMTVGCGYDMQGTVLGAWLTKNFQDKLKKLPANYGSGDSNKGYYGLVHYSDKGRLHKSIKDSKTYCDGACGMSSVYSIMNAIKVDILVE